MPSWLAKASVSCVVFSPLVIDTAAAWALVESGSATVSPGSIATGAWFSV